MRSCPSRRPPTPSDATRNHRPTARYDQVAWSSIRESCQKRSIQCLKTRVLLTSSSARVKTCSQYPVTGRGQISRAPHAHWVGRLPSNSNWASTNRCPLESCPKPFSKGLLPLATSSGEAQVPAPRSSRLFIPRAENASPPCRREAFVSREPSFGFSTVGTSRNRRSTLERVSCYESKARRTAPLLNAGPWWRGIGAGFDTGAPCHVERVA